MKNIVILASGNGTNARNIINRLSGKCRIAAIISSRTDAGVVQIASESGIPCIVISRSSLANGSAMDLLIGLKPDLVVLAGFLLMLPKEITDMFRVVNVHPSLLPKFGGKGMHGMNVHYAVIESGETESGITIHWANERYDEGEIIAQFRCEVSESDTPEMLSAKIKELELKNFPKVVFDLLNQ